MSAPPGPVIAAALIFAAGGRPTAAVDRAGADPPRPPPCAPRRAGRPGDVVGTCGRDVNAIIT